MEIQLEQQESDFPSLRETATTGRTSGGGGGGGQKNKVRSHGGWLRLHVHVCTCNMYLLYAVDVH